MSRVVRGRVVRPNASNLPARLGPPAAKGEATAARLAADVALAKREAAAIVEQARRDAEAIVAAAEATARAIREAAADEAREARQAERAAWAIATRAGEASRDARDLDRTIALAVLLAERLIGASLALRPEQIAGLAEAALREAKGARSVVIEAHPRDEEELRVRLDAIEEILVAGGTVTLRANEALARGHLRLHTDLGSLDAPLEPQLERLTLALRDALRQS